MFECMRASGLLLCDSSVLVLCQSDSCSITRVVCEPEGIDVCLFVFSACVSFAHEHWYDLCCLKRALWYNEQRPTNDGSWPRMGRTHDPQVHVSVRA